MTRKNFTEEETSSRTWIIRGDFPAEDQLGKERKEDGDRTEIMEDRESRGTYILAILHRTKCTANNNPLTGELRLFQKDSD